MNIWENTVLTDKGKILQGKLLKGQTLNIKRVTTGAKKVSVVDLRQQTDVTEGGYDITLQPARTAGEQTIIPVLLDNKGLTESYELWQVGFYAEDPDEGEILFCLAQAAQAKHIPSETDSPGFSITWDFYFNTSNTAPFEVVLSSAGLVNIEAYEAHTEAIHKVNGRINSINSVLGNTAIELNEISQSKIMVGTDQFHQSISIAIQNCREISSVVDKIPLIFFGTDNGALVAALIHLTFHDYKVNNAIITNIIGNLTITKNEWGFTINGLNNYGTYVIDSPHGVLLTSDQQRVIPKKAT